MMNEILRKRIQGGSMPSGREEKSKEELDREREELEIFEEAYERAKEDAQQDREMLKNLPSDIRPGPEELKNAVRFSEEFLTMSVIRTYVLKIKAEREQEKDKEKER